MTSSHRNSTAASARRCREWCNADQVKPTECEPLRHSELVVESRNTAGIRMWGWCCAMHAEMLRGLNDSTDFKHKVPVFCISGADHIIQACLPLARSRPGCLCPKMMTETDSHHNMLQLDNQTLPGCVFHRGLHITCRCLGIARDIPGC